MQYLAAFFGLIAGPIVKRVLIALGFVFVSYTAVSSFKSYLVSSVQTLVSAIHPVIYDVLALAGFVDMVGIWLGAFTFVLGFMSVKKMMQIVS